MAEQLLPQDRLQPALLDRLTDEEPDKTQEPLEARVVSKSRLRQSVLRDLAWLFNATRLEAVADLTTMPAVRRSVVNFGLPALSGRTASSLDVTDLARAVREAIVTFEPRILPATLQVKTLLDAGALDHHNVIGVEIRGELWAQPVPLEFLVRTEFDLETGNVQVSDLAPSSRVS
ncbi:MAG TPA: type VI secretion system baseplate subunit TssE [Vicinamibacterales bacterium]|nr:type VI secretion system baseplate subunit TssE [Vicinamibacterales bacterium]